MFFFFFFQAEDGIRDGHVTGVQTCALPISTVVWNILPPRSAAIVPPPAAAGNDAPDRDRGTVRYWPGGVSSAPAPACRSVLGHRSSRHRGGLRSEEHTSELQSRGHLVCRLLLE